MSITTTSPKNIYGKMVCILVRWYTYICCVDFLNNFIFNRNIWITKDSIDNNKDKLNINDDNSNNKDNKSSNDNISNPAKFKKCETYILSNLRIMLIS